jgi:NAD(P)-dependent dehydrogenase (short-subunit alcohol dehydrogenase family)
MEIKQKPLSDQVVVVFGASSGIGRITAHRFAQKGAKVVVSARSEEGLSSLVSEIEAGRGSAFAFPADASDFEQVRALAAAAAQRYGRIDTWVQVAGVGIYAPFERTTPEEYQQIIDVDLLGVMHAAKAALPYLTGSGAGMFIPVSSVEAVRPMPFHSAYAAAKHGVHGFVQALRLELEHERTPVGITEIQPASINTPFFSDAKTKIGVKPMGLPPIYPPEMVAEAILYAAAHEAGNEVIVGGAGKAMAVGQRLSPRLMDKMIGAVGFKGQKTTKPKSEAAPNNLYAPVRNDRVRGDLTKMEKASQAFQWLFLGSTLAAAAYYGAPKMRQGYQNYKTSHSDGADGSTGAVIRTEETTITTAPVVTSPVVTTTPVVEVTETRTFDVPVDLRPVQNNA